MDCLPVSSELKRQSLLRSPHWMSQGEEAVWDTRTLARLPLQYANFFDCKNVDLSGLSECRSLRYIHIRTASEVDLSPLKDLTVRVALGRGVTAIGTQHLGPGVKVRKM